jgi:hypothetical protein
VRSVNPLLGYFGKSGTKVNTPGEDDTKVLVPGMFMPTLSIPYPMPAFFSVFQASMVAVNSFIIDIAVTFNAGANAIICNVGPGLWEYSIKHWLEEQGAISDATSNAALQYFPNSGVGATTTLTRVTNKQGIEQNHNLSFRHLITSEDVSFQFLLARVNGAGTGLNVSRVVIVANRLF